MQKCPPPIFADLIAAGSCEARGGRQFNKAKTFFVLYHLTPDQAAGDWLMVNPQRHVQTKQERQNWYQWRQLP